MDEIQTILREKGYRVTPGRIRLLEILKSVGEPMSIRDILKRTKGSLLDQVTLYRALESFSKKGIVRRIDLNQSSAHYEYAGGDHHHHVVCNDCGVVEDIDDCEVSGVEKKILKNSGFKSIYSHNLEFFGLCRSCSK